MEGIYKVSSRPESRAKREIIFRRCKNFPFEVLAPDAKEVSLTGDFTGWDQYGIPMSKDGNGLWSTEINLPSGRYEYKFIVDQQWRLDPGNPNTADNPFGSQNSVKQLTV